jgi:hypothetical protein
MASRRTKIFWAICAVVYTVLLILVSITGVTYFRQIAASRTVPIFTVASPGSQYNVNTLNNAPNLLSMGIGFSSFDPQKGLKLEVAFDPRNNLTNGHGEPTSLICLSYQTKDAQFKAGEEMGVESIVVPFLGDINIFPFDKWTGSVALVARTGTDKDNCTTPLPLAPTVLGSTQAFVVSAAVTPGFNEDNSLDYSQVVLNFSARRSKTHIGFSILMFLVMWGLTLNITFICCWTWKGGKRTELGTIAMTAALFYGLPRIREAQPGIPKVGIVEDMLGYLWMNIMLICCLISLMINFILRKERKKAVQAARQALAEDSSEKLVAIEEDRKIQ